MEENKKVIIVGSVVVILLVAALVVYFVFISGRGGEEVSPEPSAVQAEETVKPREETVGEEAPLPLDVKLDESDKTVRELAKILSSNPTFAQWILTKDIIRKFVAAVDNIANGESPRAHVTFFKPKGKFKIEWKGGSAYISSDSFARYDAVADVFASLDTGGCIRLFRQLKPAIQEAYAELGYPGMDFEQTLKKAITELLKVPEPDMEIEVEKKVVTYVYVNAAFEGLSDAQKHLLRMGPDNVRKIQAKLKEFAAALDMPLD